MDSTPVHTLGSICLTTHSGPDPRASGLMAPDSQDSKRRGRRGWVGTADPRAGP